MVGEQTYRATAAVFDYQELEPARVKGNADPIPIWRPLAAGSPSGDQVSSGHTERLVGREEEKRVLTALFERSASEGKVQLVTVVGAPGVGKSRLVAKFLSVLGDGVNEVRRLRGRCPPYGEGVTFWALGEIVKAHAGILESDDPATATAKLDLVLPEDTPDRQWLRQRLFPLIGLESSSAAEREEAFTAWRTFLEVIASDGPTVLLFEDLHWADEAMLAFLRDLVSRCGAVPLVLVGTARPELYERYPPFGAAAPNVTRLDLGPLSEADTSRLISALLHQGVLPGDVRSLLLERAGGNPLYAEEFVRLLQDRGLLVRSGRTMALAEGAEVAFPQGIRALIAARLDLLPARSKATLQDAAVTGRSFWAGAVAATGGLGDPEITRALHELARKELVRPSEVSSIRGESEYAFWHALVQEAAYAQIPRAQRAEKHSRVAAWIESVAGQRVEDHAEIPRSPLHAGPGSCAGLRTDGPGQGARGSQPSIPHPGRRAGPGPGHGHGGGSLWQRPAARSAAASGPSRDPRPLGRRRAAVRAPGRGGEGPAGGGGLFPGAGRHDKGRGGHDHPRERALVHGGREQPPHRGGRGRVARVRTPWPRSGRGLFGADARRRSTW